MAKKKVAKKAAPKPAAKKKAAVKKAPPKKATTVEKPKPVEVKPEDKPLDPIAIKGTPERAKAIVDRALRAGAKGIDMSDPLGHKQAKKDAQWVFPILLDLRYGPQPDASGKVDFKQAFNDLKDAFKTIFTNHKGFFDGHNITLDFSDPDAFDLVEDPYKPEVEDNY